MCTVKSLFIGLLFIAYSCHAQPFNIPLQKGKYHIGFKDYWKYDRSRIFNATRLDSSLQIDDLLGRPILIRVWYPAEKPTTGKPMQYGNYLRPTGDIKLPLRFIQSYTAYNRKTAIQETFGKEESKLNKEEVQLLQKISGTSTHAYYKATGIRANFPVLIYHQGSGASLEDNILLFEYLASHGYIVINSSFLNEEGKFWGVDGRMGSVRDISFILSNLANWEPHVNMSNIAIMGHSAGSQAAHMAMAQGSLRLKAMVSLETTQEYHTIVNALWRDFLPPMLQNITKVNGQLLLFAGPRAIFQLADSMKNANRFYYTMPDVGHNDYISQGVVRHYAAKELQQDPSLVNMFQKASNDYHDICNLTLLFLDAKLKNNAVPFTAYYNKYSSKNNDHHHQMEWMPPGKTTPDPYSDETKPPTVRQFRQLLHAQPDKAIAVVKQFYKTNSTATIYSPLSNYTLIEELLAMGKNETAILLYNAYKEISGQSFVTNYLGQCEFFSMFNGESTGACDRKLKILSTH